jgi:Lar family restriction alleviation protein
MSGALKPCPHCGGKAFVTISNRDTEPRFHGQVMCKICHATAGTTGFYEIYNSARSKAISAWNMRVVVENESD